MAPGPKRRGTNYKRDYSDNKSDNQKTLQNKSLPVTSSQESAQSNEEELSCNWQRYDEPPPIREYDDRNKGQDFGVLMSFSVAAGSQFQLQEERDWDNADAENLSLDLMHLSKAYKSIPFHKTVHIPEDYFETSQIMRFAKCANCNKGLYFDSDLRKYKSTPQNLEIAANSMPDFLPVTETDIIDSEAQMLPKQTENLIQSLTSCLTMKDKDEPNEEELLLQPSSPKDDLDFLLNLSGTHPLSEDILSKDEKTLSVDAWLDSVLNN